MEKRYSWGFEIGAWVLLCAVILIFIINLTMYLYFSPAIRSAVGKAGEDQGTLFFQILSPCVSIAPISPAADGGGGGGGGGGGEIGRGTKSKAFDEITTTIELEIGIDEYISFSFGKVGHSISVIEFSQNRVLAIIKSREIRLLMYVGEEREVDFEDDGRNDIRVKLKAFDFERKKAYIEITPLYIPGSPFDISPDSLSVSIVAGEQVVRVLNIRNNLEKQITLSSEISLLNSVLSVPKNIVLQGGESKNIEIKIGPAEKGLLTGKIKFIGGPYLQEIPVAIDVKSSNFLFDVSALISSAYKRVVSGTIIPVEINMQQSAAPAKIDVTVNYIVKDFSGVVYIDESETLSVEGSKSYVKKLDTAGLPVGKYIAGIIVQYPGAFATSSSQFEIISKEEAEASQKIVSKYLSIIALLLVALSIIIIIWIMLRQLRLEKALNRRLSTRFKMSRN